MIAGVKYVQLCEVQFRPCCQVWRLGPWDFTHLAQRSLRPRHSLSKSAVRLRLPGFNQY